MSARGNRDNVIAGAWVLICIVLLVGGVLWLAKAVEWFEKTTHYAVEFSIADGAVGLKPGSEIRLGGQRVGRVTKVAFEPAEGAPASIRVAVEIKAAVGLYTDASFNLETPLLGTVSTINISSVGRQASGLAAADHLFKADLAPPSFLKSAGYGEDQKKQLQQVLREATEITGQVRGLLAKVDDRVTPALDNVRDATADVKIIAADVKSGVKTWSPRITDLLTHADETILEFKALSPEARAAILVLKKMIEDAAPKVQDSLDNVRELAAKFNNDAYPKIQKLLAEGDRALTSFADVGEGLRAELPELRITLANLRLASDQLKLTMTEVRRNPWRLLYQPGKKELERELLYDAARSYAQAVSDLRSATASLEQVSAAGHAPLPAEQLQALRLQVEAALGKYRDAEALFMKKLLGDGAAPPK